MYTGINMNFGDKDFVFDIEKYINENKMNVSINSVSQKLIKHHDIRYFRPFKSKLQIFINNNLSNNHPNISLDDETIYNLI